MSDDPNSSQPPQDPQQPLEYWHATGRAPLHPVLLAMCAIAGAGVGAVSTSVAIYVGADFLFEILQPRRSTFAFVLVLLAVAGVISITMRIIRRLRRDRSLALELRFRGGRYFTIGFLIGCGLACLAEGICFTALGFNP